MLKFFIKINNFIHLSISLRLIFIIWLRSPCTRICSLVCRSIHKSSSPELSPTELRLAYRTRRHLIRCLRLHSLSISCNASVPNLILSLVGRFWKVFFCSFSSGQRTFIFGGLIIRISIFCC